MSELRDKIGDLRQAPPEQAATAIIDFERYIEHLVEKRLKLIKEGEIYAGGSRG